MSNISFDADKEAKIKKEDIKGYGNHVFRKTSGKDINHSNEKIDKDRTHLNIDYVIDGKTFEERYEERLGDYNGKRKIRSDAVRMRGLILQPSSDVFDGKTDEEAQEIMDKFTQDAFQWLDDTFTEKNVIGMSAHFDETNPHLHVAIMPMTEDGRLSQKDFFKGPKSLGLMHTKLREHMNSMGWDFDLENKYENAEGYGTKEYKANGKQIEADRVRRDEFKKREEQLDSREEDLEARELEFSTKQKELDTREDGLDQRDEVITQREDEVSADLVHLERERERIERREEQVRKQKEFNDKFKREVEKVVERVNDFVGSFKIHPRYTRVIAGYIEKGFFGDEDKRAKQERAVNKSFDAFNDKLTVENTERVINEMDTDEPDLDL